MITLKRTDSDDSNFIILVKDLDEDLSIRDGSEHSFYAQFNKIDKIKYAVVAYQDNIPVGCGAIKQYDSETMEVKRMFVLPQFRGKGIAAKILEELENWAKELSFTKCVLETGKKQPEAISLYNRNGYAIIENYGQYKGIDNSVCFQKVIKN